MVARRTRPSGEAEVKGAKKPPVSLSGAARRAILAAKLAKQKRQSLEAQEWNEAGRPSQYHPKILKFVRAMAALGATEFEIAQQLEINTATMWRWKTEHPGFCKALEVGDRAYLRRIKRTLKHRALGYRFEAEKLFYDSETGTVVRATTIEHVPPDVNAIKFVLTNRDPSNWKNRDRLEIANPAGETFKTETAAGGVELLEHYYARLQSTGLAPGADPRVIEHLGPDGPEGEESAGGADAGAGRSLLPARKGPR